MSKITITEPGYSPVICDKPLPCPFCGAEARLAQLAHRMSSERIGRSGKFRQVRICLIASSSTLTADTFWFACSECRSTTGPHCNTAQQAVENWNKRSVANDERETIESWGSR